MVHASIQEAKGQAWSGLISLPHGTSARADRRMAEGLRATLPGDGSGFKSKPEHTEKSHTVAETDNVS